MGLAFDNRDNPLRNGQIGATFQYLPLQLWSLNLFAISGKVRGNHFRL